jgi:hypothetical protein
MQLFPREVRLFGEIGKVELSAMDWWNQDVFFISDRLILNRNGFPFAIDLDNFPSTDGLNSALHPTQDGMRN